MCSAVTSVDVVRGADPRPPAANGGDINLLELKVFEYGSNVIWNCGIAHMNCGVGGVKPHQQLSTLEI